MTSSGGWKLILSEVARRVLARLKAIDTSSWSPKRSIATAKMPRTTARVWFSVVAARLPDARRVR
jgi:hypothetical protein